MAIIRMVVVGFVLTTAACGRGDKAATKATEPGSPVVAELAKLDGIDLRRVLKAGCDAWGPRQTDSATLNQWLNDLLSDERSPLDLEALHAAVTDACATVGDDPDQAVALVLGRLGIDEATLSARVSAACSRYRQRPPPGGGVVGEPLAKVLARAGVDHDDVAAIIDRVCGAPRPTTSPDQVLPDPKLTPGDVDPAGNLKGWCAPDYARSYPAPSDHDQQGVFNAYRIAADERDRFQIMRLIPPGLGGTNAASNLFPVSNQAHPGAADKTEIDKRLTELVCAGGYDLEAARTSLVRQWPTAFAATYGPGRPPPGPTTSTPG